MGDKLMITNYQRERTAAELMVKAAQTEFEAACYRNDPKRIEAAKVKLLMAQEAWCDAMLAATTDTLHRVARGEY